MNGVITSRLLEIDTQIQLDKTWTVPLNVLNTTKLRAFRERHTEDCSIKVYVVVSLELLIHVTSVV